jgi:glycosyltransferase involved in cell wall biosynthesis
MPALNEEANIEPAVRETLNAFGRLKIDGELLVVDDGSTDRTGELVHHLMKSDTRIRLVRHETRHGVGASFWDGIAGAQGEFVCWLPGDNENDPEEILRYFGLLEHVDLVVPFVFNKDVRSRFRNSLSFLFRLIVNLSFVVNFNYTNGTVMYRRAVLQELEHHSTSFFFTTDILVRLCRRGYLFAEVPYRLRRRPKGASKATSVKSLKQVIKGFLRLFGDCYFRPADARPLVPGSATAKRRQQEAGAG